MDVSLVWAPCVAIVLVLLVSLGAILVRKRRSSPRRANIDWAAALVLELTVVLSATADLALGGVALGGPASIRLTQQLLPGAAVAVIGFAMSIALLTAHRARPRRTAHGFALRRAGVVIVGSISFAALVSDTSATEVTLRDLGPAALLLFTGPALTAVLGVVLLTFLISVALAPTQTERSARSDDEPDPESEAGTQNNEPLARDLARWDTYRRPRGD